MQITIRPEAIVSRLVAVLVVAVALAWLAVQLGEWEMQEVKKFSHAELLQYVQEGHDPSFLTTYLRVALLTLIYVGVVECVAFGLRIGYRHCIPERPAGALSPSWPGPSGQSLLG